MCWANRQHRQWEINHRFFFKKRGIKVISADDIARKLTTPGQTALTKIEDHFGSSVINDAGELNRASLRDIIFADPKQRLWLENLLHPLIRQDITDQITTTNSPYCVIEIPLLNDRKSYPYLNRVLLVLAKREQQIERVMRRDHTTRKQALQILATQTNDLNRREIADDIVVNDDNLAELEKKLKICILCIYNCPPKAIMSENLLIIHERYAKGMFFSFYSIIILC